MRQQKTKDFFKRGVSNKCSSCLIDKKGAIEIVEKVKTISDVVVGNGLDVLFILEMPEHPNHVAIVRRFIEQSGLQNYTITAGLKCRTKFYKIPSPMYACYKQCNTIKESNYKVIVPIGRAFFSVTQSDTLSSWIEFVEMNFNPSYFYTGYKWEKKARVYPFPNTHEWITFSSQGDAFKDNFEFYYCKKQLFYIVKFLKNYKEFEFKKPELKFVKEPNEFLKKYIGQKLEVAIDTETSSLNPFVADFQIGCVTLSFDGVTGYYLPFDKIDIEILSEFLKDKYQIYANGKYDKKVLEVKGVKNVVIHEDIVLLYHILSTERIHNSLKAISWALGLGGYDNALDEYVKKYKIKNYLDIPLDVMFPYATIDAVVTMRGYRYCLRLARRQSEIFSTYREILIPVLNTFTRIEQHGLLVDKQELAKQSEALLSRIKLLNREIQDELGKKFNVNSNEQLAEILEEMDLSDLGRTEKGFYKTGEEEMLLWIKEGHTCCTKILEYKKASKLYSSFIGSVDDGSFFQQTKKGRKKEGLVKYLTPDNRVHANFQPAMTDSWRTKASNPNLQNQPKRSAEAKEFRKVFLCPDDYWLCEADYEGFQLRIGAIYSGDETMKDIFLNRGGDMHSMTGQSVFCRDMPLEEFTRRAKAKEQPYAGYRFKAKGVNFGFLFGRAAVSFKNDLRKEWANKEIQDYIDKYELKLIEDKRTGLLDPFLTVATDMRNKFFSTYKGLKPWIDSQHRMARQDGFVDSMVGSRRHLPFLLYNGSDSDIGQQINQLNISVNSPVQGFEATVIYNAMNKIDYEIYNRGLDSRMFAMVHDSIGLYIKKSESEVMYHLLKECMEDYESFDIPLTAEVQYGKIWGFGKEVTTENVKTYLK